MKILVCLGVTTTRGAVLIGCSIRKVENPCSRVSGITDWQMVMAERREDQAKPFGSWCQTQALLPSFGAPPHKDACRGGGGPCHTLGISERQKGAHTASEEKNSNKK